MLRIVLDTNVLVSAIIARGRPRQLLRAAIDGKVKLLLSRPLLDEFRGTISRRKFKLNAPEIARVTRLVAETAEVHRLQSNYQVIQEDPDDDVVLNTAVDGRADYIVSGDEHLLRLKEFRGIPIVRPAEMIQILRNL